MSCRTSTYLGDAMLPRSTTPHSGPMSSAMTRALSSSGRRYSGLAESMSTRAKALSAPSVTGVSTERRPALGVITKAPDARHLRGRIGRSRKRARVRQLAAEVEAAQKGEHVADRRAVGRAQLDGEVERRPLRHDHRRAPPAAIGGRQTERSGVHGFREVQGFKGSDPLNPAEPRVFEGQRADSVRAVFRYCSIFATTSGLVGGDVVLLRGIVGQVVELERRVLLEPNRLPVPHPHGLLESALVELPVQEVVRRLLLRP